MHHLYVKHSAIEGSGVYTKTAVKKGKRIAVIIGTKRTHRSLSPEDAQRIETWYGIGKYTWLDPGDTVFRYINHSCDPNAAIVGTKTIVARRPISVDEEITLDYSMTDADEQWTLEYECRCGSAHCRKRIESIQKLPPHVVRAHLPLIPKYFLRLYKRTHPSAKL